MKYTKAILFFIAIAILFFYKTIFLGKIPFPGDLLVSGYNPWNRESVEGYVAGAVPSKNQYFDVIRELYPWKTLVVDELKQGIFPLWNPYNFSGAPLLANYQSQVFYPFTFLYYIFSQPIAWTIMVMLQPILGSFFMYLFATEIGLTQAAAILSALLFNYSSFANVWMEFTTVWHTIMWLPLLLYLVERTKKQGRLSIGQQFLFIFALFSSITAGHPQDFINLFLFLLVYIIAKRAWPVILLLPIPFFLAAAQIFPTIELFAHSARIAHNYQNIITNMLVQWWQLPLIPIAEFFGNPATKTNIIGDYVGKTLSIGVVGFLLAIFSLFNNSPSWYKKFFVWTCGIVLLLTVRTPLTELLYRYPWPILSTGTPTRMLFIFLFAFSILAGFGFDSKKKPLILIWILFAFLWIVSPLKKPILLATIILTAATSLVLLAKNKKIFYLALIPLATTELIYGFIKFNPFVPQSFVFPQNTLISELQKISNIDRFWAYGTGRIEANFATQTKLFSPDGTDPMNLAWYNRFLQASNNGNIAVTFNRTTRSDALVAPGYGKEDLPSNTFRLRMMDALGVKYILDRSENPKDDNTFPTERFKLLTHLDDWILYENLKAAPRFFVTQDVRPYIDEKDFETQFFDTQFDPSQTVLITAADFQTIPTFNGIPQIDTVRIASYKPTRVEMTVALKSPHFLFFSDTYDTGWTATVNNLPTKVFRSNYAFRGIVVPKGDSEVIFTYAPRSFQTGLAISILTIIIMLIALITKPMTKLLGKYQK